MEATGTAIIQQRLAEEKAYVEHLDLERVHRGDPSFNKTIEERIIWGELLELELQEVDEQIGRICETSGHVSTRQTEMRKNKLRLAVEMTAWHGKFRALRRPLELCRLVRFCAVCASPRGRNSRPA